MIEVFFNLRERSMMEPATNDKKENAICKDKRTAIIYTISDLAVYIVEVCYEDQCYFIKKSKEEIEQYGNLKDAREAALAHHAEEAFLALDTTYEEMEPLSDSKKRARFDYMPIHL